MFGLATFAELIFADFGGQAVINDGWIGVPEDDCANSGWLKIEARCAEAEKIDKTESEWTVIK